MGVRGSGKEAGIRENGGESAMVVGGIDARVQEVYEHE